MPAIPLTQQQIDDGLHAFSSLESMEAQSDYHWNHETHRVVHEDGHMPALDMSITSLVAFQWLAMLLLLAIFIPIGARYRRIGMKSQKGFANAMEAMVEYVAKESLGTRLLSALGIHFAAFVRTGLVIDNPAHAVGIDRIDQRNLPLNNSYTYNTSGAGATTFTGAVGGTLALDALTTNADGTTLFGSTVAAAAFRDAQRDLPGEGSMTDPDAD